MPNKSLQATWGGVLGSSKSRWPFCVAAPRVAELFVKATFASRMKIERFIGGAIAADGSTFFLPRGVA